MSRSRTFFHSASRSRRSRKKRDHAVSPKVDAKKVDAKNDAKNDATIDAPKVAATRSIPKGAPARSVPPVAATRSVPPMAAALDDGPEIEAKEWEPGERSYYDDTPSIEAIEIAPRAFADDEEPVSSRAPVVVSRDDAPLSERADGAPLFPIEHLERFAGSRWRFVATLVLLTIVGMLARERAEVAKFLRSKPMALTAAAAGAPLAEEPQSGPCPDEMALVTRDELRVCVDKWEASLVEILPDGEEKPWSPYLPVEGHVVKAVSKPGVVPQGYIDRDSAQAACESAGKRLCHVEEWIAACEGPQKTTYPYGEKADEEACNTHGKSPLGELFSASFKELLWDVRIMNDPSLNALDGTVAKTGAFARCTNGFGVQDMVGNLHEWTAERNGVFRGGYYQDATKNGNGCHYATSAHLPTYHDYSTGFRCCKDAER